MRSNLSRRSRIRSRHVPIDFEAPTALGYDVRVTQRDVILVRESSKLKLRRTFRGQFTNHFDPPTLVYRPAIANQQTQQLRA